MKKLSIPAIGDFIWPEQDTECYEHLGEHYKDAGLPLRYTRAQNVCIQAGGNIGVWPKYYGNIFKTVYTFEPNPENFGYLCQNVPEHHVIKLNAALGSENRLITTKLPPHEKDNVGAYQIRTGGIIPTFTIDSLALEACDLIQLDIEGFEYFALLGAVRTLQNYMPVVMIEDKGLSEAYNVKKGQAVTFLEGLGYKIAETIAKDVILCASSS